MSSGEPSADPTSRLSDGDPEPVVGPELAPPPRVEGQRAAPRWLVAPRILLALVVLIVPLAAVAGVAYQRYAAVYLRDRPRTPRCVLQARAVLRKPASISGSEPRQTLTGETVYLTPNEDRAIACAFEIDATLARGLVAALAEQEPVPRAAELLKVVRDQVPSDPAHDLQAMAGYMMSAAALRALPEDLPEVRAAADELEQLHACRFDTPKVCRTRPPIPRVVWITGVPAAFGIVSLTGLMAGQSVRWFRSRLLRRKAAKAAKTTKAASVPA